MKKTICADKSAPYRTNKGGKISAPTKTADEPKSSFIKSDKDLRGGK